MSNMRTLIESTPQENIAVRRQFESMKGWYDGHVEIVTELSEADLGFFKLRGCFDGSVETTNILSHSCCDRPDLPCANPFCWE
jgi:hypothetical protein